jgi:chitinase
MILSSMVFLTTSTIAGDCPGDINGSGRIDVTDLLEVIDAWGDCPSPCPADIDGSGHVDVSDLLLLLDGWGECPDDHVNDRIVAYFIEWGIYGRNYQPDDVPFEKLTHINYAFANIGEDGRIKIGDPYAAIDKHYPGDTWDQPYRGTYNQLNNVLRAKHPHIRTLISVGGWTWSGRFSDVALTPASRSTFAASCVEFIRTYNFDGVDIDWEYPVCCGLPGNTYREADRENYTLLMGELRQQLDQAGSDDAREYLLTIAAPAGYDKMANMELAALVAHLDWVNVMTYDFRGAWDLSLTNHHAPLFANPDDPTPNEQIREKYNVDWSMQAWLAAGIDSDKIVMGIPFYGRAWGGVTATNDGLFQSATAVPPGTWDDWSSGDTGINDYTQIESLLASGAYVRRWDEAAHAPWLYSATEHGGHFISYEDPQSLGEKIAYVRKHGLGGVMFWEITADRNEVLLDVIVHGLDK